MNEALRQSKIAKAHLVENAYRLLSLAFIPFSFSFVIGSRTYTASDRIKSFIGEANPVNNTREAATAEALEEGRGFNYLKVRQKLVNGVWQSEKILKQYTVRPGLEVIMPDPDKTTVIAS